MKKKILLLFVLGTNTLLSQNLTLSTNTSLTVNNNSNLFISGNMKCDTAVPMVLNLNIYSTALGRRYFRLAMSETRAGSTHQHRRSVFHTIKFN